MSMMTLSAARRGHLKAALDSYLSAPTPKPLKVLYQSSGCVWPFRSQASTPPTTPHNIAVLDSSFNPPTLAHLGLALSSPSESVEDTPHYDAHLLLLSVRNADKGVASNIGWRIEMMELLAYEMETRLQSDARQPCVALAIVDEPLIASKSTIVHEWLRDEAKAPRSSPSTRLHWLVGSDTLPRFLNPKYYPGGQSGLESVCEQLFHTERTRMVCARRTSADEDPSRAAADERALLSSHPCSAYVEDGSIVVRDLLDNHKARISSTEIRNIVTKDKEDKNEVHEKLESLVVPSIAAHLIEQDIYD